MKTSIVTGAGGFLGSHLCEHLLKRGHLVIGVDNFSTGLRSNKHFLTMLSPNLRFIEADVVQPWTWLEDALPARADVDRIFHFASPASPPHYQRLAIETMHVNSLGLERALTAADHLHARVLFASTSEVYGDPAISPQPESYWGSVNSFGERSCYDEAKRYGEALIFSWNRLKKTRHGLVRIFNTYGPRMNPNDGRVVINFIVQAIRGEPLTVYGDGRQTRSFCYVDDLIAGILKYADGDFVEPINLGNDREFTMLELAETVQTTIATVPLEFCPLPGDDPKRRRPDLTKARSSLAPWQPVVALDEGVRRMAAWVQETGLAK